MPENKQDDLELFTDPADADEVLVETDPAEAGAELNVFPDPEELRSNLDFSRDYTTAGEYLRKKREALGLTIDTVRQETKMSADHITAIENGDLDNIPQPAHPVYIVACVKKLGMLYKVDEETLNEITSGLKEQIFCQAPDDVSKSCRGHEVNEESLRRQKKLVLVLGLLAGGVVLLVLCGVILLVMTLVRPPAVTTPFDKKALLEIQPRPELTVTPMPMVKD